MEKTVSEMSSDEFKQLVERAVDRRLEVWLTQLMDALLGAEAEDTAELEPGFAAGLKRSMTQAQAGDVVDLAAFRKQLGE